MATGDRGECLMERGEESEVVSITSWGGRAPRDPQSRTGRKPKLCSPFPVCTTTCLILHQGDTHFTHKEAGRDACFHCLPVG